MTFDGMWAELADIGRDARSGGYRRFAWTPVDLQLREWFAAAAQARGMNVLTDRAGNQWAWWGDPSVPGVVAGSHLDSVPGGGAYDGPLGVASALAAVDELRTRGFVPTRPIGIANFADEEGARFGIACAGSRLLTGALATQRALALRDADGTSLAEALQTAGRRPADVAADPEALRRIACFVELHVEQGRGLVELGAPVGVATSIWPHGRFRADLIGEANHAGTTALADRVDPMLAYAELVLAARTAARRHGVLATCGKVHVEPNGVNAIPSRVTAWVDVRGADESGVRAVVADLDSVLAPFGTKLAEESWTGSTAFDPTLRDRIVRTLGGVPALATGAGHDAGVLAQAGVPSAMLFVRNPTGVSHSPAEFADRDDCLAGVAALSAVLEQLACI